MTDIFQAIDDLPEDARQRVIDRLEFRGTYAPFVAMRDAYLDRLDLPQGARVCELGCGTGVVSRAIGGLDGFDGTVIGTDLSQALVAAAQERAQAEGRENVAFRADPSGGTGEPDDSCDLVVLHTLISHVADVDAVLDEAARVAKPGATVVLFDGDYASLTFHTGAPARDAEFTGAILEAVVANPHVMRDLPRRLPEAGLVLEEMSGDVLLEAGEAAFFDSMIGSYLPMAVQAGLVDGSAAEAWQAQVQRDSAEGRFFGCCNFVTCVARQP